MTSLHCPRCLSDDVHSRVPVIAIMPLKDFPMPAPGSPSCLQTTRADCHEKSILQTGPHMPLRRTSKGPDMELASPILTESRQLYIVKVFKNCMLY